MSASDYTSEQYLDAIGAALRANDMPAVVALLHGLAIVDPKAARLILDTVEVMAP